MHSQRDPDLKELYYMDCHTKYQYTVYSYHNDHNMTDYNRHI